MKLKPATKEEFLDFLNSYPNHLEIDTLMMCEPNLQQYNDFTLGCWPTSVVCDIRLLKEWGEEDTYRIKI